MINPAQSPPPTSFSISEKCFPVKIKNIRVRIQLIMHKAKIIMHIIFPTEPQEGFFITETASTTMNSINKTIEIIKIIFNKTFDASFPKTISTATSHKNKANEIIQTINPVTAVHTGPRLLKQQNKGEIPIFNILKKNVKSNNWQIINLFNFRIYN